MAGRKRIHENDAAKSRAHRERKSREKRNTEALRIDRKDVPINRPAFRYYGGKWRLATWIIGYFPDHDCYVEPFAGAASVMLRKDPTELEVMNDLNGEVINFFDVLRSKPDALIRAIDYTPYAREEYERCCQSSTITDPVERARQFYVKMWQSFGTGGGNGKLQGWRFQKSSSRDSVTRDWSNHDHLWFVAARLKQVMIEHDDALKIIGRYDAPRTLYYCDPPYPDETRTNKARYQHETSDRLHIDLAEKLRSVEGMVIVSSYHSPLYDELYAGWHQVTKEAFTNGANYRTEVLYLSPNITSVESLPMFSTMTTA